ncbi:hypothetical protein AKJ16_DCAP11039 [Drosera capensis]
MPPISPSQALHIVDLEKEISTLKAQILLLQQQNQEQAEIIKAQTQCQSDEECNVFTEQKSNVVNGVAIKRKSRMVYNYKRLNDNTHKDQYTLPGLTLFQRKCFALETLYYQLIMSSLSGANFQSMSGSNVCCQPYGTHKVNLQKSLERQQQLEDQIIYLEDLINNQELDLYHLTNKDNVNFNIFKVRMSLCHEFRHRALQDASQPDGIHSSEYK